MSSPHNPFMPPAPRMHWTPGESGQPEPPTIAELCELLESRTGPRGIRLENGKPWEHGVTVNVVYRSEAGDPIGILAMRMYDGTPGLVDFAVDPRFRRLGVARALAVEAKRHGIDLRDTGAIWEGPLTEQGKALRDSLVAWAQQVYGPPGWEANGDKG